MTDNLKNDQGFYRLIDANADRLGEALRVVGEIVRFVLNDEPISEEVRSIRNDFWCLYKYIPGLQSKGLQSRDSIGDVGKQFPSTPYSDLHALVLSNLHRAEESLRTLEEAFRIFDSVISSSLTSLRYRCYNIEPQIVSSLESYSSIRKLDFGLYVVLGEEFSNGRDYLEVAEQAIRGGAGAIQMRDKKMSKQDFLKISLKLRALTKENKVTFIINDHIDVAMAVGADGVHLGQGDFPIKHARHVMGPNFIIGASTHNLEQARQAVADGASYFNIGPIYATQTKTTSCDPVGPEMITEITSEINHPFTVMGGIKLHNVDELLKRGARRIAVVTAVTAQDDIAAAARAFTEKIDYWRKQNAPARSDDRT
ncbi:MAG: thiamine phosphate synthase [bacterium]|nr:thiamine phosphate synthase [bacterium]